MDEIQKLVDKGVEVRFWRDAAEVGGCCCILIDNGKNESHERGDTIPTAFNKAKKLMNSKRKEVKAAAKSK